MPASPVPVHPAALEEALLLKQCHVERGRFRGGPGGTHRGKVDTGIKILHQPTQLQALAVERRSQVENQKVAIRRLRLMLAVHHREPIHVDPFDGFVPSDLLARRMNRKDQTLKVNAKHHDFPAVLAEVLDVLAFTQFEPREAADILHVTGSQIIKLIKLHHDAMQLVNDQRKQQGKHPLR